MKVFNPDFGAVFSFLEDLRQRKSKLSILINNAGINNVAEKRRKMCIVDCGE